MIRKLLLLVYVISPFMQWELGWGENYDFRYTKWGMTKEQVMSSEEKMDPIEKNENMITYKTQILGKNVALHYLFAENKLIGALYKLDDNYLNSQHFIKTYIEIKEALKNKYGRPSAEVTNWLNDTYRNVRNKRGLALSLGHVEYASLWKTENTTIECSLREEDYNVLCLVGYWSIGYSGLSEKIEKENKSEEIIKEAKLDPF